MDWNGLGGGGGREFDGWYSLASEVFTGARWPSTNDGRRPAGTFPTESLTTDLQTDKYSNIIRCADDETLEGERGTGGEGEGER